MSLAVRATRGAAWMFAAALFAKVVGVVGTLCVVRHVSPGEYGEALAAAIAVGTASTLSSLGIGQYVMVRTRGRRDMVFHATVYQFLLGGAALALIWTLRAPLAAWLHAPGLGRYLPVMAVSMLLDRVSFVPERTLMRDMRFRRAALARSTGDLGYTGVSFAAALMGWGGMAIPIGNIARSMLRVALVLPAVDRRDWLQPCILRRKATLDLFRFGLPLGVGAIAAYASANWDNLLVSSFFGPALMAAYSVAYNLATMASGIVAEQVIDVVAPTFTRVDEQRRGEALLRAAALLALVVTPLCIGLAAVSRTAVAAFFAPNWAAVAPMLMVLSLAAMLGPLGGLVFAFLQACQRPRLLMYVQLTAVVAVLGAIVALGSKGPLWTCAGVGSGALLCILVGALTVRRVVGIAVHRLLATQLRPLLACVPMVAVVLGVRWLSSLAGVERAYARLAAEVAAGAVTYGCAALAVARPAATDLLRLVRASFFRTHAPPPQPSEPLDSNLEV